MGKEVGAEINVETVPVKAQFPALTNAAYADLKNWSNPRQVSEEVVAEVYQAW